MHIRVGYELIYECPQPTPMVLMLNTHHSREAKATAKSSADLKKLVTVNFVEGQKSDEGYRFLSDVGLSVQGQDANGAWKGACHTARQLGRELKAVFIWRDKEGAAFPGITGEFHIKGRA